MTNEDRNKILEKIRKLLKLQDSANKVGSKGEAYAAAQGVHRLLTQYNLSLADLSDLEDEPDLKIIKSPGFSYRDNYGTWKNDLLTVICSYNFCKSLINTYLRKVWIVGEEQNVAVVKNLHEYLVKAFQGLAKDAYMAWAKEEQEKNYITSLIVMLKYLEYLGEKKRYFRSYFKGAVYGLNKQYESMQLTSEETALVVTHNKAIDDWLQNDKSYSGKTCYHRSTNEKINYQAYMSGKKDGRNISLAPQVKGNVQQQIENRL